MELTGKALEDFNTWFRSKRATPAFRYWMLSSMDSTVVNSVVIEFFDSVGIYITVNYNFIQAKFTNLVKDKDTILYRGGLYSARQEATREAIKEANEIYNSLA